jgi:transposase-like protein
VTITDPENDPPADAGAGVPDEVIDAVMAKVDAGGLELLGPDGVLAELTKRLIERGLSEELTEHLGYPPGDSAGRGSGNNRNGTSAKTVLTDIGAVDLAVPRGRNGSFDPQLVPKHARRLEGFNQNIVHLYARGLSTRDIRRELARMYGVEVSPALISRVTDGIVEELNEWQTRPLDAVYPILYIDALVVKVRTQGTVVNRAAYLAVGVDVDGHKHVLGYTAINETTAAEAMDAFELEWGARYPGVVKVWRAAWEQFTPFLRFPPEIRKVVYTTNLVESINFQLRDHQDPGAFPHRRSRPQAPASRRPQHQRQARRRPRHRYLGLENRPQRLRDPLPRPARPHLKDNPTPDSHEIVDRPGRTVADVARELGCDWHTVMDAVVAYGTPLVEDPARIGPLTALGLDETLFARAGRWRIQHWCTSIVDVSSPSQLLDVIPGRTAAGPTAWINAQPHAWRAGIAWGVLDLSGPTARPSPTRSATPHRSPTPST